MDGLSWPGLVIMIIPGREERGWRRGERIKRGDEGSIPKPHTHAGKDQDGERHSDKWKLIRLSLYVCVFTYPSKAQSTLSHSLNS